MKTKHLFENYKEGIKGYNDELLTIDNRVKEATSKIESLTSKYKEYVKNGSDEKADQVFDEISKLEDDKAKDIKKYNVKKEMFESIKYNKLLELLLNRKDVPKFYEEEKQEVLKNLNKAIVNFNAAMDKLNSLNKEYRKDMYEFDTWIDIHNMKKDDRFRSEYGKVIALYTDTHLFNPNSIIFNKKNKLEELK